MAIGSSTLHDKNQRPCKVEKVFLYENKMQFVHQGHQFFQKKKNNNRERLNVFIFGLTVECIN